MNAKKKVVLFSLGGGAAALYNGSVQQPPKWSTLATAFVFIARSGFASLSFFECSVIGWSIAVSWHGEKKRCGTVQCKKQDLTPFVS